MKSKLEFEIISFNTVVNSEALKMISDRIDTIQDSVNMMQSISIPSLYKNSYLILFI